MVTFRSVQCHPGLTYTFNFWHLGTLALSPERQSAQMSEIKSVGQTWMAKCNQLTPLPCKGLTYIGWVCLSDTSISCSGCQSIPPLHVDCTMISSLSESGLAQLPTDASLPTRMLNCKYLQHTTICYMTMIADLSHAYLSQPHRSATQLLKTAGMILYQARCLTNNVKHSRQI